MDLERVFQLAERHSLSACVGMALESAGWREARSSRAVASALRRAALFEEAWTQVRRQLEASGIWYLPLKGLVLKDFYPKYGMREMSDHDVLHDPSRAPEVRTVMESLGFSFGQDAGQKIRDHYFKPPVCNFEMHWALFGAGRETLAEYYRDVKSRLLPNEGSRYGFRFRDEDFYIFIIAHEYKHYSGGGTGLRSLLDTYVFLRRKGETLDWPYIAGELEKLGLADFEARNRSLSRRLFDGDPLSEPEQEMLDYILSSGTYGTFSHRVENRVKNKGKLLYLLDRFLVPVSRKNERYEAFAGAYPFFYAHKLLLPFLPFYRAFRAVKTGKLQAEVKAVRNA